MSPRKVAAIYTGAITAAWIGVVASLTLGSFSVAAFDRRETLEDRRDSHRVATPFVSTPTVPLQAIAIIPEAYREPLGGGSRFVVTAYSHYCTLPDSGVEPIPQRTAGGRWPIANVTVAADPSIPFDSELLVEGLGYLTVMDRGSAIVGKRLDLFVDTCREAREFGRQMLTVIRVPKASTEWSER